ncbi:DUF2382 domain-containing protein [Sorangium sp. So ce1014]
MPLAEEEIVVGKTVQEVGRVQITKEVITEEKQVTVPVSREVVHVPVSEERPAAAGTLFEEGSLSIHGASAGLARRAAPALVSAEFSREGVVRVESSLMSTHGGGAP